MIIKNVSVTLDYVKTTIQLAMPRCEVVGVWKGIRKGFNRKLLNQERETYVYFM